MGAKNRYSPRRHRIVGGRSKGAEGESHTDTVTHTEAVFSDRLAISSIDMLPPTRRT